MTKIPSGRFVWFEHVSQQPETAQRFLGELFHWKTQSMPGPDGSAYTLITANGQMIGGYPPVPPSVNVPAHWVAHLQTPDAKASAAQVKSLGGKVLVEPIDMGMGTYALVTDPLGGAFALWQPAKLEGTGDFKGLANTFCWNELFTEDVDASLAFYKAIGGFDAKPMEMPNMPPYQLLESDGKPRGGILKTPMPGIPQSWLPYVQVDNAEATVARAKQLGGDIKVPATEIPNVGRFAILTDPTGAALGILQPAAQAK